MKNYKSLRIIFMGTPEFAVASLDTVVKGLMSKVKTFNPNK